MRNVISIFTLSATVFLAGLLIGQDDPSKSEKKPSGNLDVTIELMSTIMIQLYEKAEPTDEQRTKIKAVIDKYIPDLVRTRDDLQTMFSTAQHKTFNAAMRLANNAGYAPDKAEAFALKKLKLPENELTNYQETKEKADGLQKKLDSEIAALLTDEQKAMLPMFQSDSTKTSVFKFKLPNMKTQKDAQSIWKELVKIKGATQFKPDVENQTVELRVPTGTPIKEKLAELVEAGNVLVTGWESLPGDGDSTQEGNDTKKSGGSDKAPGAGG